MDADTYAYTYLPAPFAYAGDVWLNPNPPADTGNDFSGGANGWETVLHELGHAIGMDHPFSLSRFPEQFDTLKYTVMSYSDAPGHPDQGDSSFYPTTPMLYDIRALQYLYGANMSYNAGDTVYTFDEGTNYYQTIWDAGGTDTIVYNSVSDGARIDLRAGFFSQLGNTIHLSAGFDQDDDVAIAFNVTIENATGGGGNDVLIGNAASNVLDGGGGADLMSGGLGNDIYYVDVSGDRVTEDASAGLDTVFSVVDFTLSANVENLVLQGTAVSGTGNGFANALTGNASDNVLNGGAGNDILDGGAGNDTLSGGVGNDSYVYDSADTIVEAPGGGSDTIRSAVSYALAVANVENVLLTGSADVDATGDDQNNALTGNSGANVLNGGAGDDAMAGGPGNDSYYVDSSGDTVIESIGGGAADHVFSEVSFSLGANFEALTLIGPEAINGTGNALNNEIDGSGVDNLLSGGAGNDVLQGGRGEDVMMGGTGNDVYYVNRGDGAGLAKNGAEEDQVIEAAGAGNDTVHSTVYSYLLDANVENLVLEGVARRGYGNALDNELTGNDRNNFLFGAEGDDTLNGDLGRDTLTGGTGNDAFVFDNLDGNIDRVMDFVAGQDHMVLPLAAFAGIGAVGAFDSSTFFSGVAPTAQDANDHLLYDSSSGALYYDDDGTGSDAAVQFATLVSHPALTSADFLVVA
jgi:serralysin